MLWIKPSNAVRSKSASFSLTSVHVGCDFGLGLAIHSTILPMRAKTPEIWLVTIHPSPSPPCENESPMNAAIPERRPATEEISGVIERVTDFGNRQVYSRNSQRSRESWLKTSEGTL